MKDHKRSVSLIRRVIRGLIGTKSYKHRYGEKKKGLTRRGEESDEVKTVKRDTCIRTDVVCLVSETQGWHETRGCVSQTATEK